jgi:hypothetical protein
MEGLLGGLTAGNLLKSVFGASTGAGTGIWSAFLRSLPPVPMPSAGALTFTALGSLAGAWSDGGQPEDMRCRLSRLATCCSSGTSAIPIVPARLRGGDGFAEVVALLPGRTVRGLASGGLQLMPLSQNMTRSPTWTTT